MTLAELKLYLRVGDNEDELIQALLTSATSYINQQTGKTKKLTGEVDPETLFPITADISTDELYNHAIKLMCAHWYEHRGIEVAGTVTRITHSVDALVNHIAVCGDYV